jgi:hypothetical protein
MTKRFKLVFLGENEEYLRDIGCSIESRKLESTAEDPPAGTALEKIIRSGGFYGRLRIGSQSLILDIDGIVCQLYAIYLRSLG